MTRFTKALLSRIVMVVGIVGAPNTVLACPVCFGALEGPVADATNKAMLTLLGITGGVLMAFATFFIYLVRRARAAPSSIDGLQSPVRSRQSSVTEGAA